MAISPVPEAHHVESTKVRETKSNINIPLLLLLLKSIIQPNYPEILLIDLLSLNRDQHLIHFNLDRVHWNPERLRRVRLRGFHVVAKISRQNVGDLVFLESQKGLAIIIQNNCIKFVTQKGYNEISSGIPLFFIIIN